MGCQAKGTFASAVNDRNPLAAEHWLGANFTLWNKKEWLAPKSPFSSGSMGGEGIAFPLTVAGQRWSFTIFPTLRDHVASVILRNIGLEHNFSLILHH